MATGGSASSVKLPTKSVIRFISRGSTGRVSIVGGTSWPTTLKCLKGLVVDGNGHFGSSTSNTLKCEGDIVAYATSDVNYKTNILNIQSPLDKIKLIGGYTYNWKDTAPIEEYRGTPDVGVIAQEIEQVLPTAVRTHEIDGVKSVRYEKIIPLLIEGMKEQQQQIEELKSKIIELENK